MIAGSNIKTSNIKVSSIESFEVVTSSFKASIRGHLCQCSATSNIGFCNSVADTKECMMEAFDVVSLQWTPCGSSDIGASNVGAPMFQSPDP